MFGDLVVFCEAAEVAEWLGGVAGEAGVQDSVLLETEVSCEGVRCVWEWRASSLDHFGGTFDVDFRDVGVGWGLLLDACKVIVG